VKQNVEMLQAQMIVQQKWLEEGREERRDMDWTWARTCK
jgi:hypothetical protein